MFNTIKVNNTDTNYTHSIFDISEYHSGATYNNLSAALDAIPESKLHGGMSVKFIQVTPARYSVVKTENLETEPTGTLLSEAPYIDSGTYDENQLSTVFSTLPSSTDAGNALTYYVAVTVDETTTYTSWVITKVLNSANKYVQYRLMSDTFNTTVDNWQDVDAKIAFINSELTDINSEFFDYTKGSEVSIVSGSETSGYGLKDDGTLFSNGDFITCSYNVTAGSYYFITGRQPAAGSAVACAYDSNGNFIQAYVYTPSTNIEDALIEIPAGASILKVCISGVVSNPNKRPSVYNGTKTFKLDVLEDETNAIYNKQLRNIFLTGEGAFYVEETRATHGSIYFNYTQVLQFTTKSGSTSTVGMFSTAVSSAGLETTTSPKGVTTLEIPSTKALVVNSEKHLELKSIITLINTDIVLLYCVAGRVALAIDEILTDLAKIQTDVYNNKIRAIYNKQLRNVFLTSGGKFYVEETRVAGGSVYFAYNLNDTANLQYFEKAASSASNLGNFTALVSASGLETTTSPKGKICLEIPGSNVLVINSSNHLEIKTFASLVETDIVLLYNVAGRVSLAIDEILTDLSESIADTKSTSINAEIASINSEITSINSELFTSTKGSEVSIVSDSEAPGYGLKDDGALFSNGDFITCSYNVTAGSYYFITGRQPAAGSAVACAYDSNDNFIQAYTYTPSTNIVDALISIPAGASILKVCISGVVSNPNKRPSVYNATKTSKLDVLEDEIDNLEEQSISVPSYWKNLLETKESSIVSKMSSNGYNGDGFIFITDIHWNSFNYGKSPILIKHILGNTTISNIFIGGDVAQNGTIPETMGFVSKIKPYTDKIFATPGNHDVTASQFYSIFGKLAENYTDTKKSTDYYFDNDSQKIRYVFLTTQNATTAISQNQIAFLNSAVSSLTSEWTVFIITHIIWHAAVVSEQPSLTVCGQSVMDAVDDLVDNTQATIGAIITGHLHRDYDGQTDGGIKIIGTTCDAKGGQAVYDPVTPTRTPGTTTEQVFDVFCINTSTKKINIYRIGGNGTDREFSY